MIRLLLLDVDGTLTDGRIHLLELDSGGHARIQEAKAFHVRDGLGIVAWLRLGRKIAIISGRESNALRARASELGITRIFMGVQDKSNIARNIISGLNLSKEEVACIGDDVNDLGMFRESGLRFAPADANAYLKSQADVLLASKGGEGAVREMIEFILQRNPEEYQEFLALYE